MLLDERNRKHLYGAVVHLVELCVICFVHVPVNERCPQIRHINSNSYQKPSHPQPWICLLSIQWSWRVFVYVRKFFGLLVSWSDRWFSRPHRSHCGAIYALQVRSKQAGGESIRTEKPSNQVFNSTTFRSWSWSLIDDDGAKTMTCQSFGS